METSEFEQFSRLVVKHYECYPTASLTEATIPAWWDELKTFPLEAMATSFQRARDASPGFPATVPQVRAVAEVEAARLAHLRAERRQERLFEPPPGSQATDALLQSFYAACDKAMQTTGPDFDVTNEITVRGLIVMLCRYYGHTRDDSMQQYGRWVVNDCKQRKLKADACVCGIRKAPQYCLKSPTLGMLIDLINGEPMGGYPQARVDPDGNAARAAREQ